MRFHSNDNDNYVVGVKATDVGRERICKLIKNLELAAVQKALSRAPHTANARLQPALHNAHFELHKFLSNDPVLKKRVVQSANSELLQPAESCLKAKICCGHRLSSRNNSRETICTRQTGNM